MAGRRVELGPGGGQAVAAVSCAQPDVTEARGGGVSTGGTRGEGVAGVRCPGAVMWLGQWSLAADFTWSVSSSEQRFPHFTVGLLRSACLIACNSETYLRLFWKQMKGTAVH